MVKLKPGYKWFAATDKKAEAWVGPCPTIDDALIEAEKQFFGASVIFVGQGYRLLKREKEEMNVDYDWEVNTKHLLEISKCWS